MALTNAVVVGSAVQVVRTMGVGDNYLDAVQLNRHMLELQGVTVQIDGMIFLTLCAGELIHNTAHHSCVLMFASLTDKRQLRAVRLFVCVAAWVSASVADRHLLCERSCRHYLHRRTAAQTGTRRHIAVIQQVITARELRLRMTAGDDINTS